MSQRMLGEIELERVIGRGGMAVVWRGSSPRAHGDVAVKILSSTDNPLQLRRFHDEIRAVARLRHPGIVDVVEMGVVPDSLVDAGPGLVAGSPWLAMEYVDGGTLRDFAPRLRWRDVRSLLTQLLEALAHAHARGIVHRDLKPANILVSRDEHGYRARISDFGIAYTRGLHERDSEFEGKVAGTPRFMAPEQIEGRWRDHGPWTDLYSLGCIAHWLVSGHSPFGGDEIAEILRGQLYGSVEPLEEERDLPDGFDRWLGNLLRKRPARRYRVAADAVFGLRRLGAVEHDAVLWRGVDGETDADVTEAFTQRDWASVEMRRFKRATLQIVPGAVERPPLPRTWRASGRVRTESRAGLSFFRLRTPPLVGREHERDQLWDALRRVDEEHQPRCVVLTGRAGTGKSRLAEWIGQRAAEVGGATTLVATHASGDAIHAGLGAMFSRRLECFGLSLEQTEDRLREWWAQVGRLDHQALHDVRVLARFMPVETSGNDSHVGVTLGNAFETFERALRVFAARRPIYLWLDDVQWSPSSLRFAHRLVRQSNLPVVIVATVQEEALERREPAWDALHELLDHPRTSRLRVEPLREEEHRALIESMLPLQRGDVDEVSRRTAGNPLFAVQLLGQCVDRGLLTDGEHGMRISAESRAVLSRDVRGVWLDRVQHAVADLDAEGAERVIEALELASAMGAEVEDAQWRHACNLADLVVDEFLLERFLDARLIERSGGRWGFVHSTLREVLEHRARQAGRWRRLCLACAESVRWTTVAVAGERERRRASYFLQAGELRTAARPLLEAAREKHRVGRYEEADQLQRKHEALCDELALDDDDPLRVGNRLVSARLRLAEGDLDAAVAWARLAVDGARAGGDPGTIADALVVRGDVMRHRDVEEGIRAHDEAVELLSPDRDPELYVRTLLHAAATRAFHSTHETATELAERAAALAERHALGEALAEAHYVRAVCTRQRGDYDEARAVVALAHRSAQEIDQTLLTARCQLEASLVERLAGDPTTAARWARRARNTLRTYSSTLRGATEIEAHLANLNRFGAERAIPLIEAALSRACLSPTDVRGAEARFLLASLYIETDDVASARSSIDQGRPAVEVGAFDRAMAIAIDRAADAVADVGNLDMAEHLWALGRMQWQKLGTTTASPE